MMAISLRILCSVLPSWSTSGVLLERGRLRFLSLLMRSLLDLRETHLMACSLYVSYCDCIRGQARSWVGSPTPRVERGRPAEFTHPVRKPLERTQPEYRGTWKSHSMTRA